MKDFNCSYLQPVGHPDGRGQSDGRDHAHPDQNFGRVTTGHVEDWGANVDRCHSRESRALHDEGVHGSVCW